MPSASTVFVDTNVLLYARDPRDSAKQNAAANWLARCWETRVGRLSTQVLNEMYVNLRRLTPSDSVADTRRFVKLYRDWTPWIVDDTTVDLAWLLQDRFPLSYWDALMVASAQQLGCRYLLTEDLQHNQQMDNVQIINPFKTDVSILNGT